MTTLAQLGKLEGLVKLPNVHAVAAIALEELEDFLKKTLREPAPTSDNWLTADAYVQTCTQMLEGLTQPEWIRSTKTFGLVDNLLGVAKDERIVGELGDNALALFNHILRALWTGKQMLVQFTETGGMTDMFIKPLSEVMKFHAEDPGSQPPWTHPNFTGANTNSTITTRRPITLHDTLCTAHMLLRIPGDSPRSNRRNLRVRDIQSLFSSVLHLGYDNIWQIPQGEEVLVALLSQAMDWKFWEASEQPHLLEILTRRIPSVLNPAVRVANPEPRDMISALYRHPFIVGFLKAEDRFRASMLSYVGSWYIGYYALPICAVLESLADSDVPTDVQYIEKVITHSEESSSLLADVSRHLANPKRPPFDDIGLDDVIEWGELAAHLVRVEVLKSLVEGSGIVETIRDYSEKNPASAKLTEITAELDTAVGHVRSDSPEDDLGIGRSPSPRLVPPLSLDMSSLNKSSRKSISSAPGTPRYNGSPMLRNAPLTAPVDRPRTPEPLRTPKVERECVSQPPSTTEVKTPESVIPSVTIRQATADLNLENTGASKRDTGTGGGLGISMQPLQPPQSSEATPLNWSSDVGTGGGSGRGVRRRRSGSSDRDSIVTYRGGAVPTARGRASLENHRPPYPPQPPQS
jgi:hypothetical protein